MHEDVTPILIDTDIPGRAEFDALEASGLPSAKVLLDLVVHMKRYKRGQDPSVRTIQDVRSASICDVMVPAALLIPEQMSFQRGWVDIDDRGLPTAVCRLPTSSRRLPAGDTGCVCRYAHPTFVSLRASCRLPPAVCRLPPASCRLLLPPADCLLPTASCRLPPADCRLPTADSLLPPRTPNTEHR